jgi:hypothetical protein
MPLPKGVFSVSSTPGILGGLYRGLDVDPVILTGLNAEPTTIIPCGFGVVLDMTPTKTLGANENNPLLLPVDATSRFAGVALLHDTIEMRPTNLDSNGRIGYPFIQPTTGYQGKTPLMSYVKKGCVWVLTDQAVKRGDPVFCRFTATTGISIKGVFRKDGDTSRAFQIPGAEFLKDAVAGALVPILLA